ncbi:MAG: MMPL family transporter [Euryarchaeota archaeon]|nr:MMPL family transporter [Euryarchaeota archaeon]MBT7063634.1 MMPL family transporter [Euryarchaeota archaeon]MBT7638789.1 MMPL family transporter [Euryarchaeota archaeon]
MEKEGEWQKIRNRLSSFRNHTSDMTMRRVDQMYSSILASPATVVILLVIIAAFFAQQGLSFQEQIDDDVEIFLPDGAPSTELLKEVRTEWSTDIAIIYVQTPNALDPSHRDYNSINITSEDYLREISWVEGDDDNADGAGATGRGIDYSKNDHGRDDGVLWIISPAQVIKEINSADGRFNNSLCLHGINTRIPIDVECDLPGGGAYAIPDQQTIDQIIEESEGGFDALFKDTNDMDLSYDSDGDGNKTNDLDGDGIWDTAAIVVGMHHDPTEANFRDFSHLHEHFQNVIDNRSLDLQNTEMTVTGLTKVLEDISDEIYDDLLKILPFSVLFTILVITLLHRSLKVVVITGTPIVMALAVTFGSSVLLDITLTPMIIATFPILIGLGVDYALHMVNRIEEVRRKEIDEAHDGNERRRRQGKPPEEVPDLWDIEFYRRCVLEMTRSTGVAVFLSALTTIVGFSVLIAPQIVSVAPIRSVGVTLCLGILSTLIFSIILVPTLSWMLRFNKRTNPSMWKEIATWPVYGFVFILLGAIVVTGYGVSHLDEMNEPITGSSEAPDGIESLNTLANYSRAFSGGQTSLFIFDAEERTLQAEQNKTDNIRDLPVLDAIDALELKIGQVDETNTTSIITFLKTIPATITLTDGVTLYEGSLWDLLHEPCWESNDPIECNVWLSLELTGQDGRQGLRKDMVNVVFDTLSDEVRSMLLNELGTKAIVYVTQPYMNLNVAGELRDEIDSLLINEPSVDGLTRTSLLTGGLPVSLDINDGIHNAQTLTTIITMLVLTILLSIVFRSPRLGIYTMIPVAVVILWQPLLMKSGDVNVNIFTAMIGTIVFGIGVDDSIHVMHRIQEEGETPTGIAKSIEETGQTIFETTATTVSGIAAGCIAAFPGLVNFFVIMCLLIFFAFITSTFLLPAVITAEHSLRAKIRGDESWIDYGDGIALASALSMKPLEAVLIED